MLAGGGVAVVAEEVGDVDGASAADATGASKRRADRGGRESRADSPHPQPSTSVTCQPPCLARSISSRSSLVTPTRSSETLIVKMSPLEGPATTFSTFAPEP